jgi:hypothetical protein
VAAGTPRHCWATCRSFDPIAPRRTTPSPTPQLQTLPGAWNGLTGIFRCLIFVAGDEPDIPYGLRSSRVEYYAQPAALNRLERLNFTKLRLRKAMTGLAPCRIGDDRLIADVVAERRGPWART